MKDLFSTQADLYAKYRPTYPAELFDFILAYVHRRDTAWDCATGNGQVARALAPHIQRVYATDISENQLRNAVRMERIGYALSAAEQTPFPDNSFDLVTVGQAYHWLDTPVFCREATRVGRDGAIVAVWGYVSGDAGHEVDKLLHRWNHEILSPYWEEERKHVHARYSTLAFDFEHLANRDFRISVSWNIDELLGHMRTWSAHQSMIRRAGESAFLEMIDTIKLAWHDDKRREFVFDVFLKLGRIRK
jgi:ubiquinone/menaquinone biosynthesis C-methylase UbiE